jgi:conjugative transfer region protein (TIGR03750 family)
MMETPDLLPNRLNFDAVVFCNCTMKELQWMAIGSLTLCILVLGICMKLIINMFLVGVAFAFPISVGITWMIAAWFQRVKQGRPKGYLKQRLLLWGEDKGFMPAIYVHRSGKWSVGRML